MHTFHRMSTSSARAGFTLVELIVVVGIVAVLATLAIPTLTKYVTLTKNKSSIADLNTIDKTITAYILDKNILPNSLADVGMADRRDPWGRPYGYINHTLGVDPPLEKFGGGDLNDNYDLFSSGADGICTATYTVPDSQDDIVRYDNGSNVGERP